MSDAPAKPHASPAHGFLLFLLGWALVFWGVIGFFVAPFVPGGWLAVGAAFALSLAPVVALVRLLDGSIYPSALVRVLVMRPFWYVQLALPFVAILALLAALVGLFVGAPRLAGAWGAGVAAGLYALFALAGYWGSRRLVVRRYEATHEHLPDAFDGVRVAQLSDLHVGPHTPRGHVRAIVEAVREAEPHLIAYTGDQVDDHDHDIAHFERAFAGIRAPLGVFAIAGNHDAYAGWHGVRAGLEKMGIRVLVNESIPVEKDGARIHLAGTGDPAGLHWPVEGGAEAAPDVARTLADVPPGAYTLALAHNPALWPHLAQRGVALTLSGHTHHGQLSIPALKWSLASPFLDLAMGSYQKGLSVLYINPGTNYWGIPLRLGAWPEVSIITLRKGPAAFVPVPSSLPS